MGERHHRYVWYDGNGKQSGGRQASISQRQLGSDVLKKECSEKKCIWLINVLAKLIYKQHFCNDRRQMLMSIAF